MSAPDIFGPRASRQMRQPKKDILREQLVLAADEIIRLRAENEVLRKGGAEWLVEFPGWPQGAVVAPHMVKRRPWWRRIFRRAA